MNVPTPAPASGMSGAEGACLWLPLEWGYLSSIRITCKSIYTLQMEILELLTVQLHSTQIKLTVLYAEQLCNSKTPIQFTFFFFLLIND
jgi:hypothetical protein